MDTSLMDTAFVKFSEYFYIKDYENLKDLINKHEFLLKKQFPCGTTALHKALLLMGDTIDIKFIEYLLNAGADVNLRDDQYETVVHSMIRKTFDSIEFNLLLFRLFLPGFEINDTISENLMTPLEDSIIYKKHNYMIILIQHNANVDFQQVSGAPLLHFMMPTRSFDKYIGRTIDIQNALFTGYLNPELKNNVGQTALEVAFRWEDFEIINILLDFNVEINYTWSLIKFMKLFLNSDTGINQFIVAKLLYNLVKRNKDRLDEWFFNEQLFEYRKFIYELYDMQVVKIVGENQLTYFDLLMCDINSTFISDISNSEFLNDEIQFEIVGRTVDFEFPFFQEIFMWKLKLIRNRVYEIKKFMMNTINRNSRFYNEWLYSKEFSNYTTKLICHFVSTNYTILKTMSDDYI